MLLRPLRNTHRPVSDILWLMFSLLPRLLACLFLAGALPPAAYQKTLVIPLVSAAKWQLVSSNRLDLSSLTKFGSEIQVDQELGVKSGSERTYRLGSVETSAIFEEAADPSSAYALYTFYRSAEMTSVPGIQMAATNAQQAIMARGRYFIRVLRPAPNVPSDRDFKSLLVMIGGARLTTENIESLPTALPQRGLVPGSEKYLLSTEEAKRLLPSFFPAQLIGLADGIEAQLGTYVIQHSRLALLEISYPTPQVAQLRFKAMADALQINRDRGPESIYGRQEGSYALLVLNSKSATAANELLKQLTVTQNVSWSPRYQSDKGTTVYQMLRLIIANLELVLIILLLAIMGGIMIFFTKRLITKLFPNSSWSRPDEDELIRLNLS